MGPSREDTIPGGSLGDEVHSRVIERKEEFLGFRVLDATSAPPQRVTGL